MNANRVIEHITTWLRDRCSDAGRAGFIVGVSGGVDSAVTSALCARTGMPTLCLEMPIHQSADQVTRAQEHIAQLKSEHANVSMEVVQLTPVFDQFVSILPQATDRSAHELSLANTRARLRMTTLYYYAGMQGLLVAGTGNKVEDFGVGFFTKYGDGGVDLSPIADLTKTEVYAVAKGLGVIDSILKAAPTDGLWGDARTDEDQIGATYPELEWAMAYRASGNDARSAQLTERQQVVLGIFDHRYAANRHKMEPIPVCIIPPGMKTG